MTHTPGPWRIGFPNSVGVFSPERKLYNIVQSTLIADCGTWRSDNTVMSLHEAQENAKLIAAAPDLAVALREMIAWIESLGLIEDHDTEEEPVELQHARAAIAKAGVI